MSDAELLAELDRRDRLLANFRAMSEWEQPRFLRLTMRIANKDRKALRLAELHERGIISRRELLARM